MTGRLRAGLFLICLPAHCPALDARAIVPGRDLDVTAFCRDNEARCVELIFRRRPAGLAGRGSVALAKDGILDDTVAAVGIAQEPVTRSPVQRVVLPAHRYVSRPIQAQ